MIHRRSKIVPFPRPIRSPRLAPRSAFRIRSFSAWTCANLRKKILVLHGFPGEQLAAFLRRVPFPTTCTFNSYRCLTAPYRYLTGSGPAFRSMFMRVLTGLTGPDPQGGGGRIQPAPVSPKFRDEPFFLWNDPDQSEASPKQIIWMQRGQFVRLGGDSR